MNKRRRKRRRIWMAAAILILTATAIMLARYHAGQTYTFEESGDMVANPFQGTYFQWSTDDPEGIYDVTGRHPDYRVILLTYNLKDEKEMEDIPKEKAAQLSRALEIAEELGLSVIFRAAYDFTGEYEDPEFDIMLSHIRQTGEVLNAHKSCLMGVQAGMIGAFGEWTQSRYMDEKKYRMEVVREWEEVLDKDIPVSVRRQKFIREAEEWDLDTDRLGIYNDGLFSSESDLGTYREDYTREEDLSWSEENIQVPFNGGEMPFVSEFSKIENVVKEGRQLGLSYLNQEYSHEVWEFWAEQEYKGMPGDEYIKKYLGCRPWASKLRTDRNFEYKDKIHLEINIENSGFARMNADYNLYFVLKCDDKIVRAKAEGGMESREKGTFSAVIENPFSRENASTYGVLVGIQISREKKEEIKIPYCLRLANEGIVYGNGINYLILPD